MYDRQIKAFQKRVESICKYINNNERKIKVSFDMEENKKYDLYVILSDDIIAIKEYLKNIKGIKSKDKIAIITENKEINHIIACINITKKMYYLYSSDEYLVNKFIKQNVVKHTKGSSNI